MNYLAHFHLAWPDEQLVLGGLLGDFYKGPLQGRLPSGVEDGIRLHRAIDAFTDSHQAVCLLRQQFPTELRRFAGILIDLGFDHFLTVNWQQYNELSLSHFNAGIYAILNRHQALLPSDAGKMAARIREFDILGRYHDWDMVNASASRIGQRFKRGNPLTDTEPQLRPLLPLMHSTFLDFYPDLIHFCRFESTPGRHQHKVYQ